jgi:hypothetical protein
VNVHGLNLAEKVGSFYGKLGESLGAFLGNFGEHTLKPRSVARSPARALWKSARSGSSSAASRGSDNMVETCGGRTTMRERGIPTYRSLIKTLNKMKPSKEK